MAPPEAIHCFFSENSIFKFGVLVFIAVAFAVLKWVYHENNNIRRLTGIQECWPSDNDWERKSISRKCSVSIKDQKHSKVSILCVTGTEIFGSSDAWLSATLNEHCETIEVLLLSPVSKHFYKRATKLKKQIPDFVAELESTFKFLKSLREQTHIEITLKIYDRTPIFKLIYTDTIQWLWLYPFNKKSSESVAYKITPISELLYPHLYSAFKSHFKSVFDCKKSIPINLKEESLCGQIDALKPKNIQLDLNPI